MERKLNSDARKLFDETIGERHAKHKIQGLITTVLTNDEAENCESMRAQCVEKKKRKRRSDHGATRKRAKVGNLVETNISSLAPQNPDNDWNALSVSMNGCVGI